MASDRSILNIHSFNELTSENDSTAYADVCVPLPDNFNKAEGLKLVAVTDCTQQRKAAYACVNQ